MPHDIAIVGLAGRFPGAPDLATFWANLVAGVSAIVYPTEDELRAAGVPDADLADPAYVRAVAPLANHDRFDAKFFRYADIEASTLDPQHRLIHELAWEALEDAGCVPSAAVAIGLMAGCGPNVTSYGMATPSQNLSPGGSTHTGTDKDYLCTRVAHKLDLKGPTLTVQTACSSSLVAVHLACQSLLLGEADVMLAGGVNVRVPQLAGYLQEDGGIVSATGQCRPFDAGADGTLFGSGGALVVLKRLRDAIDEGDLIYAVIKGSAVNNDGAQKLSYAASSREGQLAVLAEALAISDVDVDTIGLVETHGTATALGDPIEFQALSRVFRSKTAHNNFCTLGTLKSNIGHLDAAAGAAGLIKAALSLHHGVIPPAAAFERPNPKIALAQSPFRIDTTPVPWPRGASGRCAAVSAFGIGGTNAEIVVAEAPLHAEPAEMADPGPTLLVLSARSAEALDAQAVRMADHLRAHPEQSLASVCFSAATTRSHLEHRAATVASSRPALLAALDEIATARTKPKKAVTGIAYLRAPVAFLFTGQGAQTPGMGRVLYERFGVFRDVLDACTDALGGHLRHPLRDVMWAAQGSALAPLLDQTAYTQAALFAFEVALAALWKGFGAHPDSVVGHSIGEIAAAHVAGVFTLEDALTVVAARGALMQALPAGGGMAALALPEAEVSDAIDALPATVGRVGVAAVNGHASVVVSGDEVALAHLCETLRGRGVRAHALSVSHAFHSHRMDPVLEAFEAVVAKVALRRPEIPLISNVTGKVAGDEILEPRYWVNHLRHTVRFADAIAVLAHDGVTTFIEIGPRPTLLSFVAEALPDRGQALLPSVRPGHPEDQVLLQAFGGWYTRGGVPRWDVFGRSPRVRLPTYPFQGKRHSLAITPPSARLAAPTPRGLLGRSHPLPGGLIHRVVPVGTAVQPDLGDHQVHGRVVVPGAFHLACLVAFGAAQWPGEAVVVTDVAFVHALVLSGELSVALHLLFHPVGTDERTFRFDVATPGPGEGWTVHVRGMIAAGGLPVPADGLQNDRLPTGAVSAQSLFDSLASMNVVWGPRWRWFEGGVSDGRVATGRLVAPVSADLSCVPLHPALLDNAFGLAIATLPDALADLDKPFLPFAVERLRWVPGTACRATVRPTAMAPSSPVATADLRLEDASGVAVVTVDGLVLHRASKGRLLGDDGERLVVTLVPVPTGPAPTLAGRWLVLARDPQALDRIGHAIVDAGGVALLGQLGSQGEVNLDHRDLAEQNLRKLIANRKLRGIVVDWQDPAKTPAITEALALGRWSLNLLGAMNGLAVSCPQWWLRHPDGMPAQEVTSGVGRVWQHEHPEHPLVLVDTDDAGLDSVVAALKHQDLPELRLRGASLATPRLTAAGRAPPAPSLSGTVCITGGGGALGLAVARWLAQNGAQHILLVARRAIDAEVLASLAAGAPDGVRFTSVVADVSQVEALQKALDAIPAAVPLRGVVHAAGILNDGPILGAEVADRLEATFAPKVSGAWHLHTLTAGLPLDFFILFSSIAGALGSPGQAAYAAANRFLDGLAQYRSSLGLPGLSLQWGPWEAIGMAARSSDIVRARMARQGLSGLDPARGVALFAEALGEAGVLTLASLDRNGSALTRAAARPAPRGHPAGGVDYRGLEPVAREQAVLALVQAEVARAVVYDQPIDPGTPLRDLGIDSLVSLDLRRSLSQQLGLSLPPTLTFDHPTIDAVARFVAKELS